MGIISEFLRQEVPKSGKGMPAYYRKALFISEAILACFLLAGTVLLIFTTGRWEPLPTLLFAATVLSLKRIDRMSAKVNLLCFSGVIFVWLAWFVFMFGWSAGSPNILVPVLSMAFFNLYVSPRGKIASCLGLIAFRVLLFTFSLQHPPVTALTPNTSLFFQILNSIIPLVILSINYLLFSSNIQASERQLTINNQELHKEAGTDPLTGLSNRRVMLDAIEAFRSQNPDAQFSIAIADIDFFKKVNDTYGHNCGDYTLVELAKLFLASSMGRYTVCRWGGEEFCFFLPGMNLDEAGGVMNDINIAVKKMPLHFEGTDLSISITVGVEEYDFQSDTERILDRADRKLYMGKMHGRDQVVI